MKVTEHVGEGISRMTGFMHGAYTILENFDFTPPDIMQILFNVFAISSDPEFVDHVNTIKTSRGLGLLPSLIVETMLDNEEGFYSSTTKAGKWAKVTDKGQEAIFVTKMTSLSQNET
eukprot:4125978-Ditylum_brightwellii.AAC.1